MKVVVSLLCWLFAIFCFGFPFVYFHSSMDKKEVKMSHILVNTKEEAEQIKKEIMDGQSFEEMAEKHSLCPSKEQQGNIGYNMKGKLFPEIEKAGFNLNVKEVSQPVKTEEGWHLVKVYDIKYYSDKENFEKRKM